MCNKYDANVFFEKEGTFPLVSLVRKTKVSKSYLFKRYVKFVHSLREITNRVP